MALDSDSIMRKGHAYARSSTFRHLTERYDRGPSRNTIQENERLAVLGHILKNQRSFLANGLQEDFRTYNTGSFARNVFPLITSVYASLISTELFSVQPMEGPYGLIFFMELRASRTKGSTTAGQTVQSAITGHAPATGYTSELIDREVVGTGNATLDDFTATLGWKPIRPFTVQVTAGAVVGTDDGAGSIAGTGVTGTIDYDTGAIVLAYTVPPAADVAVEVKYRYVMEGNVLRPSYNLHFSKTQVEALPHSLETAWSVESEQDLSAVHGMDAQPIIYGKIGEQLRFEIDRENINAIYEVAQSTDLGVFDYTPPVGVDFYRHQLTFVNMLTNVSNEVFFETNGQIHPNWLVCGVDIASTIESLPNFDNAGAGTTDKGVVFSGKIGRWSVYKDPWLPRDRAILGYKGESWLEAGFAFCPYIPLWRSPQVTLTDLNRRVGMMSRFGRKLINRHHYRQLQVTNFGVVS